MRTTRILAIAAVAVAASFSAQAEGYGKGQWVDQTMSGQRSSADVRAEAMNPVRITNGGTGYGGLSAQRDQAAERDAVRNEAIVALRRGEIPSGERSSRPSSM